MGRVEGKAVVAIPVPVWIGPHGDAGIHRGNAAGVKPRSANTEARIPERAAVARLGPARAVRARHQLGGWRRSAIAAPREDLDHAADRVGAVQAGHVAAYDFDALD